MPGRTRGESMRRRIPERRSLALNSKGPGKQVPGARLAQEERMTQENVSLQIVRLGSDP